MTPAEIIKVWEGIPSQGDPSGRRFAVAFGEALLASRAGSLASPAAPHPAQQAGAMTEEDICAILKALGFGWSEVTNAYTMLRSLSKMGYQLVPPAIPAQQAQPMTDYQIDAPVVAGCAIACSLRHPPLGDVKASTLAAFARDFLRDLRGITAAIPAQQAGQPEDAACPDCGGSGEEDASGFGDIVTCETCRGSGRAAMSSPTAKKGEGA